MYNQEWLNINANRKYPFKEESNLKDETRRFQLPDDFLVDALLIVPINYQFDFYVSKVSFSIEELAVTISMRDQEEALTGTIQYPDLSSTNQTLALSGRGTYNGGYGKLVIGSFSSLIEGEFNFLYQDTTVEPCRIIKLNQGITSLNGITSGNIILKSGTNVVITPEVDQNKIIIDTFDGLCACDECPTVKTINGRQPVNNNFSIAGIGCVTVTESGNGIQIGNDCEEACCGCDEVNDMVDRIRDLQERITILENNLP